MENSIVCPAIEKIWHPFWLLAILMIFEPPKMKNILLLTKILLVLVFSYHVFNYDLEYSPAIRFLGLFGFGLLSYDNYKKDKLWFGIWLAASILINPFLKIELREELWGIIPVVLSMTLLVSLFIKRIT